MRTLVALVATLILLGLVPAGAYVAALFVAPVTLGYFLGGLAGITLAFMAAMHLPLVPAPKQQPAAEAEETEASAA